MPKIEVSQKDLCGLIGRRLSAEQLADEVLYAKSELDEVNGDTLKIDIKDTNRPDLWSTEGIAREIRARYGKGTIKYDIKKGREIVKITTKSHVQPLAVCAIARGLKINEHVLSQIIQLQEKLSVTFGSNRKEISMGVYDLDKIKFPIVYSSLPKEKILFAPLGYNKPMSAEQILTTHQKGKEFGHLLKNTSEYPVWLDADKKILSMPPIINSNDIGNVNEKTRNVLIECTGYDIKFLRTAINILAVQMIDRGAVVESVMSQVSKDRIAFPELTPKKFYTSTDYIRKVIGIELPEKNILELLKKTLYNAKIVGRKIELLYPAYRQDIMHERDVVEDIAISYGFNSIEPTVPKLITKGNIPQSQIYSDRIAELMAGAGFQEILSYTLTNVNYLFANMNMKGSAVEIEKPMSSNWSVFRTSLLPGLMEFLTKNMHVEYPQNVFEIGNVVVEDAAMTTRTRDVTKMAAVVSAAVVNYDQISSVLDALMRNLGIEYKLKKSSNPSFIEGRTAEVLVGKDHIGFVGEIHPLVLNNWNLENPVVAFEINLEEIFKLIKTIR